MPVFYSQTRKKPLSEFPQRLLPAQISYTYVSGQLQISFYVLRLVFRNALSYESPAEYQPSRSFF